jgi:O-acetylserine/cysteine efflux transporter
MKILSQSGCTDDSQPGPHGTASTAAGLHGATSDIRSDIQQAAGRALAGGRRHGRPLPRPRRALGALIGASILWGGAVSGTKFALGGFAPLPLLSIELLAATAVLWAALLIRGYRPPGSWWLPLVLGLLEPALAYLGDTFGLATTSAVSGGEIDGLESALVVLLAAVLLRERMTRPVVLSVLAGLAGLIVLAGFGGGGGSATGDLFIAGGVLSASLYTVVAKRFDDGSAALSLTTWQFTAATVVSLAVTVMRGSTAAQGQLLAVAPRFWIAAALTGIGGFALSFLLFNAVIAGVDAGRAAVVLNLIPVFGVAGAVTFLGERVTGREGIGAVLIGASVLYFTVAERHEAKDRVNIVTQPARPAAGPSGRTAPCPLALTARPIAWQHRRPASER